MSRTMPPPSVCVADASRMTKRSPLQAAIGRSSMQHTSALAPGSMRSPSSIATRASTSSAPWCRCTVARCWSARACVASARVASKRVVRLSSPAACSQSPRAASAFSMPARFSAQRCPATPLAAARSCACSERTRALTRRPCGPGTISTRSPTATRPACTVPATMVPMPGSVKLRSIAMRKLPPADRAPKRAACSRRCAPSASTPVPSTDETGNTGQCAAGVPRSRDASCSSTAARRAASTASILVSAITPRVMPSCSRMSRCSSVCGMTPSSAATTSSARSMPVAPASMVCTKRSCPGTSMKPSTPASSSAATGT